MLSTLAHLFTPKHTNNHRARIIHPEGFAILTAIALVFHVLIKQMLPFTPAGQVLGFASSITASSVLESINRKRAEVGAQPLALNTKLTEAAVTKATDMFGNQYWSHTSPNGTTPWVFIKNAGYSYSIAGENLARDFGDTQSMVDAWYASPTHKANLLQKRYTETGIAVVNGNMEGVDTTLVVQMFGAPAVVKPRIIPGKFQVAIEATPTREVAQSLAQGTRVLAEVQQQPRIIISPTDITRSFFIALAILLVGVLAFDMAVAKQKNLVRAVGKNLAHIMLFIVVLVLLILKQGGSLL